MSLLNKAHTRLYIDKILADGGRAGRFTQVSKTFYERLEARLKVLIADEVHRHPSVGQTLK